MKLKEIGIWISVTVILTATVWGLLTLVNGNSSPSTSSQTVNPPPVVKEDIVSGNPQKAKVTLIEYADFQCPACAEYAPLVTKLKEDFGDKLLLVYRFFPLPQHQNAILSSQASFAARKQNKFLEMSDLLYGNQVMWADSAKAKDIFVEYAKKLNLNLSQFTTDLDSEAAKKFIEEQKNAGVSIGISGTPTFFVNGKFIQNPPSYSAFKQIIQDELNQK